MSLLSTQKNSAQEKKLFDFTNGIAVDVALCQQEIKVQKAWAESLVEINLMSLGELVELHAVLDEALNLMLKGRFDWRIEDEDIHMNIERFVTEKLGALGKQMHLGRSRNDLIATTLKLYTADILKEVQGQLTTLVNTLAEKAEETVLIIVPGATHLQNAQPVRFGHILAAHAWGFVRDAEKTSLARNFAMKTMPLGSAALAGTTLAVDLAGLANRLGFSSPCENSYDAVGDRDFMLGALDVFSNVALHLSRLAEDLIYWASTPVGLVRLPKKWSTGSSIMPNKRNPDVPELIRAKAAHIMGAQTNAYLLMKALPTSYDSDLHELKAVFIRAFSELQKSLMVSNSFLSEIEVCQERAAALLKTGHLLATEVANHLTQQGVSFREAYAQTAALVELAETHGVSIEQLKYEDVSQLAPRVDRVWLAGLNFENAVEARAQVGGTGLKSLLQQIKSLKLRATS